MLKNYKNKVITNIQAEKSEKSKAVSHPRTIATKKKQELTHSLNEGRSLHNTA